GSRRSGLFRELAGRDGRITVTIEAEEKSLRYQGIVPLAGDSLAESLEAYFASSEQLPTRVRLAADAGRAAGLLVRELPGPGGEDDEATLSAWRNAERGIDHIRRDELLQRSSEDVLRHGFSGQGEDVRVFRGSPVRFECRCSPQRVAGVLRALGSGEVRDV